MAIEGIRYDERNETAIRTQIAPPDQLFEESDLQFLAKSRRLFADRFVMGFARRCLHRDAFEAWYHHALSIQAAIYRLDLYYEQSRTIASREERPLWLRLQNRLQRGWARRSDFVWSNFWELKQYSAIESRIHAFDPLDVREFGTIARLKCADVRIARSLVWSYARGRISLPLLRYWELHDQCWELIEDLMDLSEDGRDWNFNFWLYSFMAGGDATAGTLAAVTVLRRKLYELEWAYAQMSTGYRYITGAGFQRSLRVGAFAIRYWWLPVRYVLSGFATRFGSSD